MFKRPFFVASGAVVLTLALAASASAQYFGQNKVQSRKFQYQILKTDHFDIYFYPQEREGAEIAARMAERWFARLEAIFDHTLSGRQPLVLYASHPDFEQTNVIQGQLGEGTGGVTEPVRRRIVLPFGGPLGDTDHVIGHELVHAFQFDITTRRGAPPGENGAERLPLWFIEGMAEYLSLGSVDPNTAMWVRDALVHEKLPTIDKLDDPDYFPYRWGQAFWAYVAGTYGDQVVGRLLNYGAASGGDLDVAFKNVLGVTTKELSAAWQQAITDTYGPMLASTSRETGRLVVGKRGEGLQGELNVGPSISPDGRWIAFLSERNLISIDLYVADASTGKVIHKLTSTASDPHYSSIQFIYSAGGWDRTSTKLAIAVVTGGKPALAIFNAVEGRKEREIPIADIDEIFNPAWAPDGQAICFTGMSGGLLDLYVYDLNASSIRRLTKDAYAELQPAWSPDGRRIAFATDRFSSDLQVLRPGPYRLAVIDVRNDEISQIRTFDEGRSINPQWSPDGNALYFLSDRSGISNLYRVSMANGAVTQLTEVVTGISGITNTSPALSVGAESGTAAFSIYEAGQHHVYTLSAEDLDSRARPPSRATRAAALPPVDRSRSEVEAVLANASNGLPEPRSYEPEAYKAKLSLEAVGQPMIAVGASQFGTTVGGGIAFLFSDMLNQHSLTTAIQLNSGFSNSFTIKDVGAQVAYLNQAHRWNWGVIGGQMPYLTGGFASGLAFVGNEPAQVEQTVIVRQTERTASGVTAYPFSRAQRLEFQGGLSQISFDQTVETTAFSLITGQVIADSKETTAIADTLTLGTASAALVYDTSVFGATSPVQGQRYRLQVSPTAGSIGFTSVLADYRRYFMPLPFYTIAARVMHYGRYGAGGEDARLFPLYIGYPDLVRGYDVTNFDASDCGPSVANDCPLADRLQGSRLLVGNIELRFPLLRPAGASRRMYGPLPMEVALFADVGAAWNRDVRPSILGGSRGGVSSAGAALRINLLGFAVGEFDVVRPFQRPGQGWMFQFNLAPGF